VKPLSEYPATRVRVLHVIPQLTTGGAETMMVRLLTSLDPSQFDVAAVSLFARSGSALERDLDAAGVPVRYLNKASGFDPKTMSRINAVLGRFQPDVVHTHLTALAHALPVLLWRRHRAALHTVHNLAERETSRATRLLHRAAFLFGVKPVAIAHAVEDSIVRVYGTRRELLIPNGVAVDAFRRSLADRAAFRAEHRISADAVVFVTAGRLSAQKNHALLVKAFAAAFDTDPNRHLLIAGEGALASDLRAQAASLGVGDRVHLLGLRTDLARVFSAADVFALSSGWEGHPLIVMEALAAGLPVIATSVGGVPEIVDNGVTGLLLPPGDTQAFSESMRTLAASPDMRAAMARVAAAASRRFDVSVMTAAYADAYRRIAGRLAAPAAENRTPPVHFHDRRSA
jgi:glycosyltransferase involved in cell wall biosynthesis